MKIQCVLCKEIVSIGAFKPSSDGIRVRCAACQQEFFLPASGEREAAKRLAKPATKEAPAEGDEPEDPEAIDCPKCFQPVSAAQSACAGCGLMRERFDSFAAEAAGAAPPALEALWEACEAHWEDADAHEKFVELAAGGDDFAYAARRYRQVIRRRPRDTVARLQLERIAKMTEAAMMARKAVVVEEEGMSHYKGLVILLVLLVVVGGAAGYWVLTKLGPS